MGIQRVGFLVLINIPMIVFCQKDNTTDTIPSKPSVILPKTVSIEVVKDILRGDSATQELLLVRQDLLEEKNKTQALENIIKSKDQEISILREKETNYQKIISLKDIIISKNEDTMKKLNKDLKKSKFGGTFKNLIIGSGIIVGIAVLAGIL